MYIEQEYSINRKGVRCRAGSRMDACHHAKLQFEMPPTNRGW